jgi:hypothetical protein
VSEYRRELVISRLVIADSLARAGEHVQATAEAEALAAAADATADTLYKSACVLAVASAVAKDDAALPSRYAARAVAVLRQAFAKGFRNVADMLRDSDLAPLRRRADYFDLLWDLADMPQPDRR